MGKWCSWPCHLGQSKAGGHSAGLASVQNPWTNQSEGAWSRANGSIMLPAKTYATFQWWVLNHRPTHCSKTAINKMSTSLTWWLPRWFPPRAHQGWPFPSWGFSLLLLPVEPLLRAEGGSVMISMYVFPVCMKSCMIFNHLCLYVV